MLSEVSPRVLQFCHGYDAPFLDCARQYASLFDGTPYKVTTVYLTGRPSLDVERGSASDEVIFLGYQSKEVRGLKLKAIRDLKRIAEMRDFCFCIAHRSKPTYVALLATKLPVVSVHHAFGDYKPLLRRALINFFRDRLLLLGVSDAVRDDLRACFRSWPHERIETLYNRINVSAVQNELLSRVEARMELGLPGDAWVIGNVGRLHPDKDQATLIRGFAHALPKLPPGSLLAIMGSGPLAQSLRDLAVELGVEEQVRFLGQISHGRRYFKAFDVFVLSSDHEPFGMVLLEAMAASLPIICSDCGGGAEVVRDYGQLFPFGHVNALAQRLQHQSRIGDLEGLSLRANAQLKEKFSDEHAQHSFFALPAISTMIAQPVDN